MRLEHCDGGSMDLRLSTLPKTWIFDLDGTLLEHNGYKFGGDKVLSGVEEFFKKISENDYVIILTARKEEEFQETVEFLKKHNIRFDKILFNIPIGERVLFNDRKPSGLDMAFAINLDRDMGLDVNYVTDEKI